MHSLLHAAFLAVPLFAVSTPFAFGATLAADAGSTGKTWRAYLSTQEEGKRGISARDRIGPGPWHNAKGELIAKDLDQLHLNPNIVKSTALDENGNLIKGRGDSPNEHDILTGTQSDGTAYFPRVAEDRDDLKKTGGAGLFMCFAVSE